MPRPNSIPTARLPLFALALASFAIGTTEYVIMGLLPSVAQDLRVSIPQAGLLVTGYALSVAFGSPWLTVATARMDRRTALLLLAGVFIIGNTLCAVSPSYGTLMAARIVTALCHGAFFGLGAVVAADLAEPHKKARAIAIMFAGLTLANVLGVPLGTALGEALGWRQTFWAVVVIGIAAAAAHYTWLPRDIPAPRLRLTQEARTLGRPQVILAMLVSVLSSASLFSVFTYITPILEVVTRVTAQAVTPILLLFGVGLTIGNLIGGRLGDWKLMPSLLAFLTVLVAVLALFTVTSDALAPNLASTINVGAFNFGNAVGAWIGAVALIHGEPYDRLPWIGAALAAVALVLTVVSYRLDATLARPALPTT
jgi:DHA1 family inner membrane transport protein